MTVYTNSAGNNTFRGIQGEYNQVDYDPSLSELSIYRNSDGSVTVSHPTLGTDTLFNIDGFWSIADEAWYSVEDAIAITPDAPQVIDVAPAPAPTSPTPNDFNIDSFGVLRGSNGNDVLVDSAQSDSLYGGLGNDTLVGTEGKYSQAEYDGFSGDYTFTQNNDGSLTVSHAVYGTDTLTNIDGFWFQGEGAWYAVEDLPISEGSAPAPAPAPAPTPAPTPVPAPQPEGPDTGTTIDGVITGSNDVNDTLNGDAGNNTFFAGRGTDVINGGAGNDTLNVDGDILEWTFSANADGSVTMTHPTWGQNTLNGIENIFSQRAGEAFSIDEAIALTDGLPRFRLDNDDVINGTNGNDVIEATADVQGFYGGTGDDVYFGTGNFEQVNYDGSRSEYDISQNGDGSITVDHPIWGTDTLNDIDALIFTGVEPGVGGEVSGPFEFISTDDLFA